VRKSAGWPCESPPRASCVSAANDPRVETANEPHRECQRLNDLGRRAGRKTDRSLFLPPPPPPGMAALVACGSSPPHLKVGLSAGRLLYSQTEQVQLDPQSAAGTRPEIEAFCSKRDKRPGGNRSSPPPLGVGPHRGCKLPAALSPPRRQEGAKGFAIGFAMCSLP